MGDVHWDERPGHDAAWRVAHKAGAAAYRAHVADNADDPVAAAVAAGVIRYMETMQKFEQRPV